MTYTNQPPMPPPIPPMAPPPRSWWSRNWKWFVPVGCLLPILVCGGLVTTIIVVVFGAIKSSEPYKHGLAVSQADSAVVAALGSPVEPQFFAAGSINITNDSGNADLIIPIKGPKSTGVLHVVGTKSGGVWSYSTIDVQPGAGGQKIDLLKKPAP